MAIEKIQLPNGQAVEISEWLHWPLFSTVEGQGGIGSGSDPLGLGNGAAINLRLFSYIVGQQIPRAGTVTARAANESDTNQVIAGKMGYDEAFLCYAITPEFFALTDGTAFPTLPNSKESVAPALTAGNIRRLQRDCVFSLVIGAKITKPQARAPMPYFNQGVGAVASSPGGSGLTTPPNTTLMDYGTSGSISPRNQRLYNLPVLIDSDRAMYGKIESPGGTISGLSQNWRMRWYLDGLKRRPVA